MDQSNLISPYPGLRPFSEAESLYFKGREGHIASIQQELMLKRFLMVTGASGDGKSSLVYAGLLPNVRAGFLRGEFGKWAVAILRPGHIPMQNLSDAVSGAIKEKSSEEIKEQLKYGYSALANLYKQSNLFINKENSSFRELDEKEQKKALRKGSNLLIVVDQFEEFFTSDNNFNKETALPGVEAMLVMNLLIETARLAKEQNLPIYIICTMRSDYIGNAPAYRGLPELIGNNQFFVPRLIREELVQVIEEPADLNGNAISKRLVQRLINDLDVVNTDVLPSLQHGLRQIWEHAEKGIKEMDLFQYAQVGGMNSDELPENDKKEFVTWFDTLPAYHQQLIVNSKPGISNILNLHANLLYETAHEQAGISITKERSQQILKNTFQCLTQIDDSRAVRHRMTIDQIKEIAKTNNQTLNALLKIFRLQGNTLVYPFLLSEQDKVELPENTLLDITHEALIRNWKLLLQWTQEEYEDVVDYRELDTAVQRWKQGGRKKEYLFSEGTYEHFVTNHGDSLPSPEWTKRYVEHSLYVSDGRAEKKINENSLSEEEIKIKAVTNCKEIKEYLQTSKIQIEKVRRSKKIGLVSISTLLVISIISSCWIWKLNSDNLLTAKSNFIAGKASTFLSTNPTLSFRLAEEAFKIKQTDLSRSILIEAYSNYPFYNSLNNHKSAVLRVILSKDNNYFATISGKETILWNTDGKEILNLKDYHANSERGANMEFSRDSKFFIVGTNDGRILLYNLPEKKSRTIDTKLKTGFAAISLSFDSQKIIIGDKEGGIGIYNMEGGLIQYKKEHKKGILILRSSSAANLFFSSAQDNKIIVWNDKLEKINEIAADIDGWVDFNFSPDGKKIAVASTKGIPFIWNFVSNKTIQLNGHSDEVWSAYFSPDGKTILTSSIDKSIMLWNAENGKQINTFKGHTAKIWKAKFSADGQNIISVSDDCTARIWDLKGNTIHILKGHNSQVVDGIFTNDSKYAITTAADLTIKIWDINASEIPNLNLHFSWVDDAKFSDDGSSIVTGGYDYTAKIWDNTGHLKKVLTGHHFYGVYAAKFLPGDKEILTGGGDKSGIVWSVDGTEKFRLPYKHGKIYHVLNSADGRYLGLATWSTALTVWNNQGKFIKDFPLSTAFYFGQKAPLLFIAESTKLYLNSLSNDSICLTKTIVEFKSPLQKIVTSNDDRTVAVTDDNNHIYILYLNEDFTLKQKTDIGSHSDFIKVLKFSPDRKLLASAGIDNQINVWKINGELLYTLTGHAGAINDLDFSNDSRFLISASNDYSIKKWDLLSGNLIDTYNVHKAAVEKVSFSTDDNYILSASNDQKACLMPASLDQMIKKIDIEKVRGHVYQLTEDDKKAYGIK